MATILVVDDEPSILRLVAATLEAKEHTVITADNGIDGIALARTRKPDLILLDIMMPQMDGTEVRHRLAKDRATATIPVIHLSAVGDFQKQLDAFDEGVADYITKPFTPKDLQQTVADILDPGKREQLKRERAQKSGKTRTIVEIMRRHEDH